MTALEGKALLDHGKAIAKRYAGRVGSDVAEELGAEAVLRALRSPPPDGHLEPWLERIYRNLIVDVWRRRRPATVDVADLRDLATSGTPEDAVLARERRRMVRASVARLPREARRALLSRYYGELDDEVSASRLGIAGSTIRTRIHRALGRLRGRLEDLRACCRRYSAKLGAGASALGLGAGHDSRAGSVRCCSSRTRGWGFTVRGGRASPSCDHDGESCASVRRGRSPVAIALPHKRVRAATRTRAVAQPAQEAPTQIIAFVEREEVVADIQRPEVHRMFSPIPSPSRLRAWSRRR
jgi:RNA polymerase sigma factor (sigma-70 family)